MAAVPARRRWRSRTRAIVSRDTLIVYHCSENISCCDVRHALLCLYVGTGCDKIFQIKYSVVIFFNSLVIEPLRCFIITILWYFLNASTTTCSSIRATKLQQMSAELSLKCPTLRRFSVYSAFSQFGLTKPDPRERVSFIIMFERTTRDLRANSAYVYTFTSRVIHSIPLKGQLFSGASCTRMRHMGARV